MKSSTAELSFAPTGTALPTYSSPSALRQRALQLIGSFTICLTLLATGRLPASAQINVFTRSYDNNRTGANLKETILTPANVSPATFGKLYTIPTDGQIYAQPLYASGLNIAGGTHNVVFVSTMLNTVYALDADTGGLLWKQNFGTPMKPQEVEGDENVAWSTGFGILGTPVIDPSSNTMYFVSANEVTGRGIFLFHLNAVDITTGLPVHGSPVNITATYSMPDLASPLVLDPFKLAQRPGLALANGNVYIAFGSHDDGLPYHGWVLAYSTSGLTQTAVYADTTTGSQGGIWNAGGGPTVDPFGNIYISTGNGSFGPTAHGVQTGNSMIKLSPTLQLLDYFTPTNSANLNAGDQDLGSSGLLLIPNLNLILGGGKQGVLYLVDPNAMGKFNSSSDQVRQEFQAIYGQGTSHIHGAPIYFNSDANGPSAYVWGENDVLRGFKINAGSGIVSTTPFATSTMTAPATNNYGAMPGGFMAISANGNANGIVWASTPYSGDATHQSVQGVLYAFNADTLQPLWSDKTQDARDEVGLFAKYCPPVVANGKVFVSTFGPLGTTNGSGALVVYGLLAGQALPQLRVDVADASMTAGSGLPTLTGNVTGLVNGDQLGTNIIVTYSTTASSGSPAGTYPITAKVTGPSAGNYRVSVSVGTLTVLAPQTSGGAISLGGGFGGSNLQLNGSAQISGTRLRLTTSGALNQAASAFYPTPLNVQSFTNDFTFQLTNPAADGFTMVLQNAGSTALGAPGGALGYGPGTQNGIARSVALKFDLFNNAGEGVDSTGLYTNGASPTTPAVDLTSSGVNLESGDVFAVHAAYDGATLGVTITDTVTGATSTQSYTVNIPGTLGSPAGYIGFTAGTGGGSATQDILTWTYTPQPAFANGFSASQLTLNGGAALSGTNLRLLDGGIWEARSAFFTTQVNVQRFTSAFTFQLANPAADGITFTLQSAGAAAVGGAGGSLGFGPIQGTTAGGIPNSVAVKFDLFDNGGEGANSTGIFLNGASPFTPATNLTGTGIDLHSGHVFSAAVGYDGTTLTVTLTDTQTHASATQTYTIDIPGTLGSSTGYVGFTGASGGGSVTADIQTWTYLAGAPAIKVQLVYPTGNLTAATSGPPLRPFQWNGFPDGNGTILDATQVGDNVTLTVNVPTAARYDIGVTSKQFGVRGIFQLSVDGTNVGPHCDEYDPNPNGVFKSFDLGVVNLSAGNHSFKFTVVGRNPNSTDWRISFGQLLLNSQ